MEPSAPAAEEQDPSADTPEPSTGDTGEATPEPQQSTVDWEARALAAEQRVNAQQGEVTRQQQLRADAERRAATLESARPQVPGEATEELSADAQALYEENQALRWDKAAVLYGPESVTAATAAMDLITSDSPLDWMSAFEAYHQARSGGAPAPAAQAAEQLPTREEAVQPRVDVNRSDVAPQDEVDQTRYAGGANGGVAGWIRSLTGADRAG